ncbi:ABC transporter permease [Nocardioides sp. Kera G14]|uniref:ABC transporter permease n=1 Tax=Nocardioides sp. Kera G14 TaxID=2884264 RepID=UPI001D12E02D|nr:ABC transporter permease subunit [Nocardioides sp. Kera G14]UDY24455.1 ABC transporter permease subunit [Nocardioides sp. Kera G14]
MSWLWANHGRILDLTWQHLVLSIVPVVLGLLLAIPLGWWAFSSRRLRTLIVGLAGVLYTLPSLPLLIILPGLLGTSFLDPINVVVVLTLYAVALFARIVTDAFDQVGPQIRDAVRATGFSGWQRFISVELPLAGPVILAGVRVVSVGTVSLVTVGAIIGVSNLGSLFTEGFQRNFRTEILIGVAAVVLLALVLDVVWVLIGRLLMPWTRVVHG